MLTSFAADRLEPDRALRLRTWNAQTLLEIADCDYGVVPHSGS